jgi:ribosomal protein S12 methylthiotransferase
VRGLYWIETLGCAKNEVDSDHLAGGLISEGYAAAGSIDEADLVVVNTCAFIESARTESVETILDLADRRRDGARLVVTGCLAARAGAALAEELPEVDLVADVGIPVTITSGPRWRPAADRLPSLDLMRLPRPRPTAPWAYVKIAEGCDRRCGFCAIPSFRGPQRSRTIDDLLIEVDELAVREVVLVSQDLASFGRDRGEPGTLHELVERVDARVDWVRLLYLFPTALTDRLIETIIATGVPYFDLSLQHVSSRHLRRMRRPGSRKQIVDKIARIRSLAPEATLRSSFILGYPGEQEEDHDELLGFLEEVDLDWVGLFPFSSEEGTYAAGLGEQVPPALALERLRECAEIADRITARRRADLVGTSARVLVEAPGVARSVREAPEIDGIITVPADLAVGHFADVRITASTGPDLEALPVAAA